MPAPRLNKYWFDGNPLLLCKYLTNANRSPEKLFTWLEATKLNTFIAPLFPENSFQLTPAMEGVETGDPVLEIGPAPPSAVSQIIISYSVDPVELEDVNMS